MRVTAGIRFRSQSFEACGARLWKRSSHTSSQAIQWEWRTCSFISFWGLNGGTQFVAFIISFRNNAFYWGFIGVIQWGIYILEEIKLPWITFCLIMHTPQKRALQFKWFMFHKPLVFVIPFSFPFSSHSHSPDPSS